MDEMQTVQWFPGHMTKARRMISDQIAQVDAVCEVLDARIPFSSRIPDIEELTAGKPRLILLNRCDQASPEGCRRWKSYFESKGYGVLLTDSKTGKGTAAFKGAAQRLLREKLAAWAEKGQAGRQIKLMVVGVPNVGKSSFINRVSGRKAAETSDRPGVTRGKQWITVDKTLLLLDTPGILWPKFDCPETGMYLAFTGAIRDGVADPIELARRLLQLLRSVNPAGIRERFKFEPTEEMSGAELLDTAAKKRGFLISGGELDTERAAYVLLDEFRASLLGKLTLELPEEAR